MSISRVYENLKKLKSTDLHPKSAEEIQRAIVSATDLAGDDLPHYVVPHNFHGLSCLSDDEHIPEIYAFAGIGITGFIGQIKLYRSDEIIIYEPISGLAYLFLSRIRLNEFFGQSNVHVFTDLDAFANALKVVYEWWKPIREWKSPPSVRLFPDKIKMFHQHLIDNALIGKINFNTLNKCYFQWIRNEIENLHTLRNRKNAISCPGGMKNIPAVLVGAGPSLRHSLSALKDISQFDHMVIIAASTTLRVLVPEGIVPHFVIVIEGEKQTHFENIPNLNQVQLLAHLQTFPEHLKYPFKDVYWFNQETSPLASVVSSIHPEIKPLKFSGHVLSAAFLLAKFWGCNPIAFTGMDLAYQTGNKYMKGLEKNASDAEREHFYHVPGQNELALQAPPEFLSNAQEIEMELEHFKKTTPEFRAVNASIGGRRIKETIEMPLEDFASRFTNRNLSVKQHLTQFISSWPSLPTDIPNVFYNHLTTYQRLETMLDNPPVSFQEPYNLKRINELMNQLPEFNTDVVRLIPWVKRIRFGRNLSETDLSLLNTTICQILDGFPR